MGSVLVRNEDVFVERAIRNAAAFCDRIHVLDHMSSDGTREILRGLARELDHLEVVRSRDSADSHRALAPYFGTSTWALGIDGDELFDPAGLASLRAELEAGAFDRWFRVRGWILHCDELDEARGRAFGYLAPPSRPITKLFNLGAVERFSEGPERLHWTPDFRDGYAMQSICDLAHERAWDDDPLRMLHVCFLRRSSADGDGPSERQNLPETGAYRRRRAMGLIRRLRPYTPGWEVREAAREGLSWKRAKYARGPRIEVDARPFSIGGA